MSNNRNLEPATRVEPDPARGWRAADLDESELVDDNFIECDPDSTCIAPEATDGP